MKLFKKAYTVDNSKFNDYINKSCDEDPEQYIRRKNYFDHYGNHYKDKELNRMRMHYDTIKLLDNTKTCEKFKKYMLSDPNNANDEFKIKWGSTNLLKNKDNEVCYLDALHDIYKKDNKKAENTFLNTIKLRKLLDSYGKSKCIKTKEELAKRINIKNSTMKMTSRRKTSRRKTSRRKTSRRND